MWAASHRRMLELESRATGPRKPRGGDGGPRRSCGKCFLDKVHSERSGQRHYKDLRLRLQKFSQGEDRRIAPSTRKHVVSLLQQESISFCSMLAKGLPAQSFILLTFSS
jgi:hypothetical protein